MRFAQLIREHRLVDIITVDDVHYAILPEGPGLSSSQETTPVLRVLRAIPGCVPLPASQLHTHLAEFLERGHSERFDTSYTELAGLKAWALFTYGLTELPATKKQQFSHALTGSAAQRGGMLLRWQGKKLGRSAFLVPLASERDALSFLARWSVDYTREVVLRAR